MPQKADESHEEYRERQQTPVPKVVQAPHPHPAPPLSDVELRLIELEDQMHRVIDACCKHHAGLCRDLEGPKTEE